jgi:predicted HAD superfamily Cof-like phosphohydrolase
MTPMTIWEMVEEFHRSFNLPVGEKPALSLFDKDKEQMLPHLRNCRQALEGTSQIEGTVGLRALRIKLLLEEVAEYIVAELDNDLVGIADALTDIHYIAAGTEVAYGIPGSDIFKYIHANNMSKLGLDGKPIYRADGKVIKPDNWIAPSIEEFLK